MGALSPAHIAILLLFAGLLITGSTAVVVLIARAVRKPPTMQPGWYPDQAGVMRWFDGQKWTESTQQGPR